MPRTDIKSRIDQRKKIEQAMRVSPVMRVFNAGVKLYEDIRGLNIGGAESGRRAKASAVARYLKSQVGPISGSDRREISRLRSDLSSPGRVEIIEMERLQAQVKPLPKWAKKRPWGKKKP